MDDDDDDESIVSPLRAGDTIMLNIWIDKQNNVYASFSLFYSIIRHFVLGFLQTLNYFRVTYRILT